MARNPSIKKRKTKVFVGLSMFAGILVALQACQAPVTTAPTVNTSEVKEEADRQEKIFVEAFEAAQDAYSSELNDIVRIAYTLKTSHALLCPDHRGPAYGFTAWNRYEFLDGRNRPLKSAPISLGDNLTVVGLA
ncbi:MAG: hypothetical protein AAGH45_09925, partial [Pseudomonadota bacterium]